MIQIPDDATNFDTAPVKGSAILALALQVNDNESCLFTLQTVSGDVFRFRRAELRGEWLALVIPSVTLGAFAGLSLVDERFGIEVRIEDVRTVCGGVLSSSQRA